VTAILLALGSSVAYGLTDFFGGLAARRAHILMLGAFTQPLGLVLLLLALPFWGGELSSQALFWGFVSGVGGACAYVLLFRSLALGPMSVASPLSAIVAVVLPVAAGVAFGERLPLLGWIGIALGIISVLMVSQVHEDAPHALTMKVFWMAAGAGVFISVFLVALERTPDESGLWPLIIVRVVTTVILVVSVTAARQVAKLSTEALKLGALSTTLDVLATLLFLMATREGLLTVVAVITALYPAATIVMAKVLLGEHLQWIQRLGFVLAAVSVCLLAVAV
jgi:uncharacterized membrane protein